ncbi:hypothetical protein Lal_00042699 [Lupinus albus]|nr:hypothetical protein Lal_00042699 [Lupinus albus]
MTDIVVIGGNEERSKGWRKSRRKLVKLLENNSNAHQGVTNLKLKLTAKRNSDGRINNLPTVSEFAALIVRDIDSTSQRDIIMETQSGKLKRINELHASYLAFQYPLLFPHEKMDIDMMYVVNTQFCPTGQLSSACVICCKAFRNAAKRGVDNSNSITYECINGKKRSISNIPGHTQRNIQARDEPKRSINWYCSDPSLKSYSESATQKQNILQFDTYLHTFIMNLNIT